MIAGPHDQGEANGRSQALRRESAGQDGKSTVEEDVDQIIEQLDRVARTWRETFTVSIGRASVMTGLKEHEIRYFEELKALRPEKSTGQGGATRLFSLLELRRLYTLARLRHLGYRPSDAAEIVRTYQDRIDRGIHSSLASLIRHEGSAITDGFLLARLMSQLLDAAQIALTEVAPPAGVKQLRVFGALVPMRPLVRDPASLTEPEVRQIGRRLAWAAEDTLIALARDAVVPLEPTRVPQTLVDSGRNETTILFYSPEAWEIPGWASCRYCVYMPDGRPELALWLMVDVDGDTPLPPVLHPLPQARAVLFDHTLQLCARVFHEFRSTTLIKQYRYRSDGFQIEHTRTTYSDMLKTVCELIFPDDPDSMAVLLIPNSLDDPKVLAILAHHGYDDELAYRAKLSLDGGGQGLCGRAYTLREPFLSLAARVDPRVAYGVEEGCRVAFAAPLMASWGLAPFGVLYLASKKEDATLSSEVCYVALVLGSILGELLGRWWLTRLRRTQDVLLHERAADLVRWLDSLDEHGADFQRALDWLERLWQRIHREEVAAGTSLALAVLDVDQYRARVQVQSNEPLPLATQNYVCAAIQKILPEVPVYWCKNDHAILLLEDYERDRALAVIRRVLSQVAVRPLPVNGADGRPLRVSVSAAVKVMTYQDLYDLDREGGKAFRCDAGKIIDELRAQTSLADPGTVRLLSAQGWVTV
ncbi:MAG TPA: MerR family transcriptional regulator [Roseiflexaceae bacterium]|nr:MerR family transcriptional regulator [Roseiflexaceae bacterium]